MSVRSAVAGLVISLSPSRHFPEVEASATVCGTQVFLSLGLGERDCLGGIPCAIDLIVMLREMLLPVYREAETRFGACSSSAVTYSVAALTMP